MMNRSVELRASRQSSRAGTPGSPPATAVAVLELASGNGVVATLKINHRFQAGQLLKNALQDGADFMRHFIELQRRANTHVHAHDLGLNRNVRMFGREPELVLRPAHPEPSTFN